MFGHPLDEGKFHDITCDVIFNHHVCTSPPPSRVRLMLFVDFWKATYSALF